MFDISIFAADATIFAIIATLILRCRRYAIRFFITLSPLFTRRYCLYFAALHYAYAYDVSMPRRCHDDDAPRHTLILRHIRIAMLISAAIRGLLMLILRHAFAMPCRY